MNADSRRVATRRVATLPCQAVREHDFTLIADRTLDVSTFGMLLPAMKSVQVGEAMIVSFPIPGMWIDAEAVVSRVIHGRRPADEGPAVGIVFEKMSVSARAALAGFLHGRPPTLPRRGPPIHARRGSLVGSTSSDRRAPGRDAVDGLRVLSDMASAWRRLGTE